MPKRPFDITRTPRHAIKDLIDHDYLDKLSNEERAWLADFDRAYYQGDGPRADEMCKGDKVGRAAGRNGREHTGKRAGHARMNAARRDIYTAGNRCDVGDLANITLKGGEEE